MKRRTFIKGIIGTAVIILCPVSIPEPYDPFKVYMDAAKEANNIRVGYKCKVVWDEPYVYCPYIPVLRG